MRKYTKDFLEPIVQQSTSMTELLYKLDLQNLGGNYGYISGVIQKFNISISHFVKKGRSKQKPLKDYLSNQYVVPKSDTFKKRLIKEGYFEYKCYKCGAEKWLNNPIPLELHHIDNNHDNNSLNNLTLLCPNCHACAHQERSVQKAKSKPQKPRIPTDSPRPHTRKVERPDYETLLKELSESNYSALGRKYGVSDNAIRKWIKFYEKHSVVDNPIIQQEEALSSP